MNRTRLAIIGLLCAILLVGCVPSLNPFYRESDVKFDERLLGSWKPKEEGKEIWTFERGENKSYRLTAKADAKTSVFSAHLFAVQEKLFIDLQPDPKALDVQTDWSQVSMVPAHLLVRVNDIGNTLKFSMLDFAELLKNKPSALSHQILEGERIVLTASTTELQRFITAHLDTKSDWSEPSEYTKWPSEPRR